MRVAHNDRRRRRPGSGAHARSAQRPPQAPAGRRGRCAQRTTAAAGAGRAPGTCARQRKRAPSDPLGNSLFPTGVHRFEHATKVVESFVGSAHRTRPVRFFAPEAMQTFVEAGALKRRFTRAGATIRFRITSPGSQLPACPFGAAAGPLTDFPNRRLASSRPSRATWKFNAGNQKSAL